MIVKKVFISILFSVLAVAAPSFARQSGEKRVSLDIKQERQVPAFGIKIKFLNVLEDSRCPEGRQCIWAGNAKIRIAVWTGRQKPVVLDVNSTLQPQVVNYGRYEIRLATLDPRPSADNGKPSANHYVATLTVRRLVK
jgi:hypothetical protein